MEACGRKAKLPCHADLSDADLSYLRDVAARATTQGNGRPLQVPLPLPLPYPYPYPYPTPIPTP